MTDPADGRGYPRFLLGLGAVSLVWFVSLAWLATSDIGLLVSGALAGLTLAVLAVRLLPGAAPRGGGAPRRLVASLVLWALSFGVFLVAGLLWNREETFYWLLTAPLVAGPAFIGAQVEGRR
jgi:hypothetical protein